MNHGESFAEAILAFNNMYKLPVSEKPILLGVERLENFKKVLMEEVSEVDEIIVKHKELEAKGLSKENKIELLTEISDWMGDMTWYIRSEAMKFGINLEETLKIIRDSNFSKLGVDGKPIYDERGKVMKGPNYWKPEPKIAEIIEKQLKD